MKINTFILVIILFVILIQTRTYSQCGCCSAAFSGSALAAGTSNIGVLKEGTLRVIGLHRFLYGDKFYEGSTQLKKYYDEEMMINFTGVNIGYGITKSFTLETEIGAFPDKDLNFGYTREKISGFSSFNLIGKYTLLADRENKQEITIGAGGRIPITSNTTLSGNPGAILQLFYFKGLGDDFNLIFLSRAELHTQNSENFLQGNSFINSLFVSKLVTTNLYATLETRLDYLDKSFEDNKALINTGRSVISVVPQISYSVGKFSLSGFVELPIYKYYTGIQLSENIGAGIALVYMLDV